MLGYQQTINQLAQTLAIVNMENSSLRQQVQELQIQLLQKTQEVVPDATESNGE